MSMISVIVPVYRVENYIRECIDSILCQTFSDFELILVDDGSPDKSGEICDEYASKDARIKVIHQENAGQSASRNRGTEIAEGEYICFIDSDDIVNPIILEKLYSAVTEYDCGIAVADRIKGVTPPDGFFDKKTADVKCFSADEETLLSLFREGNTLYWTLFPCIMKKEIYLKFPLAPGRVMEDNAVACKWLYEAKKTAFVNAPLYFYRENPNGTMNAPFSEKKLDFLWALEQQLEFLQSVGYQRLCNAVALQYINDTVWLSRRVSEELKNKKLAKEKIDTMRQNIKKYAPDVSITEEQERKIFKILHPVLHKIMKKF